MGQSDKDHIFVLSLSLSACVSFSMETISELNFILGHPVITMISRQQLLLFDKMEFSCLCCEQQQQRRRHHHHHHSIYHFEVCLKE